MSNKIEAETGVLYVVALSIGNEADLSPRAKEALSAAEIILAEDTRRAGILMSNLGLKKRLVSYYDQNETSRVDEAIRNLKSGSAVALVSDAGTPCISDPGYRIVKACHENQIRVRPIPGASAVVTALSVSGLPTDRFVYEGFLPPKGAKRTRRIQDILDREMTSVVYESTHKIQKLIDEMAILSPDRLIFIAREMTKTYEEFLRGTTQELATIISERKGLKGEMVVVISGNKQ